MTRELDSHGDSSRREELMREEGRHPTPEQIATLLDPSGPRTGEVELRAHLAACRRCFGLFTEMAETHLTAEWSEPGDPVPADLVGAVKAMNDARPPRSTRPGIPVAAWAGIAAVVLAGSALWFVRDHDEIATVRRAVAEASAEGMVLTADVADPGGAVRASGAGSAALTRELKTLARRNEAPGASAEDAYWLAAGMLVEGDPFAANSLDDAITRFPGNARLENLAAVAAFRAGRFDEAKRRLDEILRHDSDDPMALFNRAVLARKGGTPADLEHALNRLYEAVPSDSRLRARAEKELDPVPTH